MKQFLGNITLKDIVYLVIIGVVCFFGWRIYNNLSTQIESQRIEYKQLSDTLARAFNEVVTKKDLQTWAKELNIDLKKINKDLQALGADLKAVGQTVASIDGKIVADSGSDDTDPHDPGDQPAECKLCDTHGYTAVTQIKNLTLGEMPYGRVYFDASKVKPWTVEYDAVDIKVDTVLGETNKEPGTLVFYHTISTVNKTLADGKEYPLKIVESVFRQTVDSTKEWYWFAPHLSFKLDNIFTFQDDWYKMGAALDIGFMAYGNTRDDNEWRFLHFGLGLNTGEQFYISLEPVKYNIGTFIPLISDMWLGVGATWGQQWGMTVSLGTTL